MSDASSAPRKKNLKQASLKQTSLKQTDAGPPSQSLSAEELLLLRMTAQGLADTGSDSAADPAREPTDAATLSAPERIAKTTRHMLALQGQEWRSARWALGLRTPGTTLADVHAAFDAGLIVRSWPMRGTVHVLPAEDIGWIQQTTNQRVLATAPKRRDYLGLSDTVLQKLVDVSIAALDASEGLTRDELTQVINDAGIEWKSNWRYHLIWWLCQNGFAVFGPVRDGSEPLLVSASRWIKNPNSFEGDDALAELAARYATARGAVTARDFAWWSGLTAQQAKRGLTLAAEAERLTPVTVVGTEKHSAMWADLTLLERPASDAGLSSQLHGWHLLPSFDEHLLGYQDRAPQLQSEHFEHILPGRNGIFMATIVHAGRVVGTWKRGTRKNEGIIGSALPGSDLRGGLFELESQAAAWSRFHGYDALPFSLVTA